MATARENFTQPPDQNKPQPTERLSDIRNLLGLLLAGFTGAVNVIGLRNAELTTILRNHGILVGLASTLLLAALICAIASVFADQHQRIHLWIVGSTMAFLFSVAAFSIYVVQIPKSPNWTRGWILGGGLLLAAVAVGGIIAWLTARPTRPTLSLQFTLLIASAILFSTATATVVRIEAKNQASASLPQLEAGTEIKGDEGQVTAKIAATKLRDKEDVYLGVVGLPYGTGKKSAYPCAEEQAAKEQACDVIADVIVYPDSFGNVEESFKFPFSPALYQHLEIFASVCESRTKGKVCEHGEKSTSVDINISRP